jgi:hypothetical protein
MTQSAELWHTYHPRPLPGLAHRPRCPPPGRGWPHPRRHHPRHRSHPRRSRPPPPPARHRHPHHRQPSPPHPKNRPRPPRTNKQISPPTRHRPRRHRPKPPPRPIPQRTPPPPKNRHQRISSWTPTLNPRFKMDAPRRSIQRLVVPLLGCDDDGKVNGLLPVWRAAPANPRMSGGHRTSEDGGKARGSKCKAIVPSHGRILPPKKKNAMRKIILARFYALRILCACPTPTNASKPSATTS